MLWTSRTPLQGRTFLGAQNVAQRGAMRQKKAGTCEWSGRLRLALPNLTSHPPANCYLAASLTALRELRCVRCRAPLARAPLRSFMPLTTCSADFRQETRRTTATRLREKDARTCSCSKQEKSDTNFTKTFHSIAQLLRQHNAHSAGHVLFYSKFPQCAAPRIYVFEQMLFRLHLRSVFELCRGERSIKRIDCNGQWSRDARTRITCARARATSPLASLATHLSLSSLYLRCFHPKAIWKSDARPLTCTFVLNMRFAKIR